jgi:hypothetical protein
MWRHLNRFHQSTLCDTLDWGVKFAEEKAAVNGFTACDFVAGVRIDIRICRF